jgi:hypothetical protein
MAPAAEEDKAGQTAAPAVISTLPPNCPDLGAELVTYEIIKQIDPKTVRVRITGKVKNVGSKDFRSAAKQAVAQFSESEPANPESFKIVVEKEILALPVGEFFPLEYERDWETADLDKFSDQPHYRLEIKYAPDILQDGNPDNDDCVAKNNKKERTSKELRRIWAVYPKSGTKSDN